MNLLNWPHDGLVHPRRVKVLRQLLAPLLPAGASVLDVGCGDGLLACQLANSRPDCRIEGIDVMARRTSYIPTTEFDGVHIPYPDHSVDVVMFVDVLHHTIDPRILLSEAARVARHSVILKDHTRNGLAAASTLRFMDVVGNAHHGVALPYNYWSRGQWHEAFHRLGLAVEVWQPRLQLYPMVLDWFFGRSLHFVAKLRPARSRSI